LSKLVNFKFSNYQRIREEVSVPFDKIVLLCGPNSAGKSTIVDGLNYMRQLLDELLVNDSWKVMYPELPTFEATIKFNSERVDFSDEPGINNAFAKWYKRNDFLQGFFLEAHDKRLGIRIGPESISVTCNDQPLIAIRKPYLILLDNGALDMPVDIEGYALRVERPWYDLVDEGLIQVDPDDDGYGEDRLFIEVSKTLQSEHRQLFESSDFRVFGPYDNYCRGEFFWEEGSHSDGTVDDIGTLLEGIILAILDADWPSNVSDNRTMLSSEELSVDPTGVFQGSCRLL